MSKFWKIFSSFCLCVSASGCTSKITYKMEILNSPIGMVAVGMIAPDLSTYTELDFYAYNLESDFSGYKISVGTSKAEARASKSYATCLFTKNSNLNVPTRIQLGGAAQPGFDCYISAADAPFTVPLTVGSNSWVSVKSFGSRDCSQYNPDSGCSEFSDSASAEVLPYVAPPTSATIQYLPSPDNYYFLQVDMGAVVTTTGLGLFYSPNKDEAEFKASEDGSIYDGFCSVAMSGIVKIQIGGTPAGGMHCYISNFYMNTGDTIAIRNGVSRAKFPWSDFVSVTVP